MAQSVEAYRLQEVLFPAPGAPSELYLRRKAKGCGSASLRDGTVLLSEGETVTTDTYFNCFYLAYWNRFARPGRIGVRIVCSGPVRLCGMWHGAGEDTKEIASQEFGGAPSGSGTKEAPHVLWLGDSDGIADPAGQDGRLSIKVQALGEAKLHRLEYVTDTAPPRDVSLSIGICTFNREDYLVDVLRELRQAADANPAIRKVHVVNQGAPFASEGIRQALDDDLFSMVEQGNLGGCGGFNRSMYEALNAEDPCTHHLLMDDDIRIDARVIASAIAFLRYAPNDVVLGGHMLLSSSPGTLYEAGAVFDPFWFFNAVGRGADMTSAAELDLFNDSHVADYNAWWFCIVPVAEMKAAGYSPPIFIRGDDMEYGCRMGKRGLPTVPLPGVAVWHDLNFSYGRDWDQYYDIRNRLILCTLHGDVTAPPGAHFVLGYVIECLLTHRYMAAQMCMTGVSHYLLGPGRLFEVNPAERHREISELAATELPRKVDKEHAGTLPLGEPVERLEGVAANSMIYLRRVLAALFLPHDTRHDALFQYTDVTPMAVGNRAFVVTDPKQTVFVRFEPNRRRLISLFVRALALTVRLMWRRKSVEAAWRRDIGRFQTAEAWRGLFEEDSKGKGVS